MRRSLATLFFASTLVGCGEPADRIPDAADQRVAVTEDEPADFQLDAADPDGDALTWAATEPAHGKLGLHPPLATYTPAPDFTGTDLVEVTVSDGSASVRSFVVFDVAPVADAPRLRSDTFPAVEDEPIYLPTHALLANDVDPDGDPLRLVSVATIGGGTATLGDEEVMFTPAPDLNGLAHFSYTVTDGSHLATTEVLLRVGASEDPPETTDDVLFTDEDQPVDVAASELLRNDVDPDGDSLVLSEVDDPVGGTAELTEHGVRFTPAPDFHGDAGFVYRVTDGREERDGWATVVVASVDDLPVAKPLTVVGVEDQLVVLPIDLLRGQTRDGDGDPLAVVAVGEPVNGSVGLIADQVRFWPAPDASGPAGFTYTVSDGVHQTQARVTIMLGAIDDPPVALGQARVAHPGEWLTVQLAGRDADDPVTVELTDPPAHGTLAAGASAGELRYLPAPGFLGDDSIAFVAHGGALTSAPARITFVVRAP